MKQHQRKTWLMLWASCSYSSGFLAVHVRAYVNGPDMTRKLIHGVSIGWTRYRLVTDLTSSGNTGSPGHISVSVPLRCLLQGRVFWRPAAATPLSPGIVRSHGLQPWRLYTDGRQAKLILLFRGSLVVSVTNEHQLSAPIDKKLSII